MSPDGYIMQLQPFSVNDGDGIRTTVFLAGCPLRCSWCSNPEGFNKAPLTGWYERKCIGCGACVRVCKEHIGINLNQERERCTACGKCTEVCPAGARVRLVTRRNADDIIRELSRHELFYRSSGGGVTFSGGEATAQPELLEYLTAQLYDLNISMALESSGYFDFDELKAALSRMDLIFMDLKLMDEDKHRQYTGVSNKRILDNIARLSELPAAVVIRIPVIAGVNADEDNIRQSAQYVHNRLPKAKMELLPYHKLGLIKYEAAGIRTKQAEYAAPSKEEMERLRSIVRAEGVEIADYR